MFFPLVFTLISLFASISQTDSSGILYYNSLSENASTLSVTESLSENGNVNLSKNLYQSSIVIGETPISDEIESTTKEHSGFEVKFQFAPEIEGLKLDISEAKTSSISYGKFRSEPLFQETSPSVSDTTHAKSTTILYQSDEFWKRLRGEVAAALQLKTPEGRESSEIEVLDPNHLHETHYDHIKCLTPHLIEAMNSDHPIAAEVLQMFEKASSVELQNTEFYFSPSGKFRFQFTRTGTNAVPLDDTNASGIPDYVELAAVYADSSYNYMVNTLGFRDFVLPLSPYRIEFRRLATGTYGFTQISAGTTFIVVHSTFLGFSTNDDPDGEQLGALKVTIAHEIKHAIQYATSQWLGNTGTVAWIEMDATLMEEIVFDPVNDYYNYLTGCSGFGINRRCSIFSDPGVSTPVRYQHITWSLYYVERNDIRFWVDVWDDISTNPQGSIMTSVIEQNLNKRSLDFDEEFTRNHLWHYASGENYIPGYGFEEAAFYPTPVSLVRPAVIDSLFELPSLINVRAARYIELEEISNLAGSFSAEVNFTSGTIGVGILAHLRDGSIVEHIQTSFSSTDNGFLRVVAPFDWNEIDEVAIVFTNPRNTSQEVKYTLLAIQVPEVVTLLSNYPNPFNSRTTLEFTLPGPMPVEINVYDVQGRLVRTLLKDNLLAGFYTVPFNAIGLASGVYIYTLNAGSSIHTGKMMLIK